MTRNLSITESETKSEISRASQLSILNDDECKRILSVVERDFKLRQKEFERLEEIKKIIRQENERVEYLAGSKEFNLERCIRCFKPFRFLFNPREQCTECKLFVCHDCATYTKEEKTWACKSCLKLKELEVLTSNWFYFQSSKKHKRCGSAKVVRELHKREKELADLDEFDDDDDLGYGTLPTSESKDFGSVISYITQDKNIKRELDEYSKRLTLFVEKLQADLAERNIYNNHRTVRGKSKETLKDHQQQIKNEIARARVALSGPLRRSNVKTNTTHERDLQNLLIQKTEQVLQTNLQQFHKALTAPNSSINANNFDEKLSQAVFDKCVSREIFQELPGVIDSSTQPPEKPQRQSSTTSSLTSLTKPSSIQPTWSTSSPRTSSTSWEIKSRNDNIRKVNVLKNSTVDQGEDTEEEREQITNGNHKIQTITTTESIEFDNGLKLDLSSIDDDISDPHTRRRSIDHDFEAINRSNSRVGDWETNFTLIESKSSHSGEETPRSNRESVYLTIPVSDNKNLSPRIGDRPLEDLADDDLYADDQSSSYPIPINTTTIGEHSQISDNDLNTSRKIFPLPVNLLLQNHSSCSFRRPSYTYESDNESMTSSISNLSDMKSSIDEEKFRMDPNINDPKFLLRPKDTTVRLGETVKFKVKVSGTEPIDVFWFRFGTDDELVNDEKYQLSHDAIYHYLKIYSTNKDDEGAYLCVIANDKAQNVDIVKLHVKNNKRPFQKPSIIQEFSDTDVNEGSAFTLKCKLDQGYPKARILWYKENTLIQPNDHHKLYYFGDGQHALHVSEATIEDDNGTFTCLALNATGRVQITADVFVHEKEVIDLPRNSPIVEPHQRKSNSKRLNMNNNDDDDDDPQNISPPVSPLRRTMLSDNEEQMNAKRFMDKFKNDRSSQLLENWQNLYESSVHSLQSDDDHDELKPATEQPFYLNRQSSVEKPLRELLRSPTFQPQHDSNSTKPKWEIRLPQLLNTTVGPDRQKRDLSRRHTTHVVLQQQQKPAAFIPSEKESNPLSQSLSTTEMLNPVDDNRPPSPLVKQLKQKFDRMIENNELSKSYSQSQTGLSKVPRVGHDEIDAAYPLLPDDNDIRTADDNEVASLTCRGLTSNNGERPAQKSRPMLPIRTLAETNPIKVESFDNNNKTSSNDNHHQHHRKGKTSPPISYPKDYNTPRPTTFVIKQLIGDGATLVYDSLTQDHTPHTTPSLLQHHFYPNHHFQKQRKEHVQFQQTNPNPLKSNSPSKPKSPHTKTRHTNMSSNDDEIDSQKKSKPTKDIRNRSTSMSDNVTIPANSMQIKTKQISSEMITPVGRKTVLARAELWDRRISTNENETDQPPSPYDIEQWSTEFEKIQNEN